MVSTGTPAACAFIVPVRAFVAPGPDVTSTTPSVPLTRANPSAMYAAPPSWRQMT